MWFQLEDMVFRKSLFLLVDSFQPPCSWLLWNKHICELTCIERVSRIFQITDSLKKCCSISPAFVLSHPLWNHCLGNVKLSLLSKLVFKLLLFEQSYSNNSLVPKVSKFLYLFFYLKIPLSLHVSIKSNHWFASLWFFYFWFIFETFIKKL